MRYPADSEEVRDLPYAPIHAIWEDCIWTRKCPRLGDGEFVRMRVARCLGEVPSGRGFLQQWAMEEGKAVAARPKARWLVRIEFLLMRRL